MIVGPVGSAGVRFLRASHPSVAMLVVDRRGSGPCSAEAVLDLEAGADGDLANPPVAEVGSHVRAFPDGPAPSWARRRSAGATAA